MLRTNFVRLIWRLIIVVIDVNLGTFDVLFDPIGYALIAVALFSLGSVERSFAAGAQCAMIALGIAVIQFLGNTALLVSVIDAVLQFLVLWYICTGVLRLAQSQGHLALSVTATRQRMLSFAASITAVSILAIGQFAPDLAKLLLVPAFLFALAVLGLTLLMLRQASQELAS